MTTVVTSCGASEDEATYDGLDPSTPTDGDVGLTLSTDDSDLELTPTADTYVRSGRYADRNYGTRSTVEADRDDGGTTKAGLVRFDIGDVGSVTRAVLHVYVANGSAAGADLVAMATSDWNERSTTWSNKPPLEGRRIARIGAVKAWRWVSVNVSTAVQANSVLSLAVLAASSDGLDFASRDGSRAPRLRLWLSSSTEIDGGMPEPDASDPATDAGALDSGQASDAGSAPDAGAAPDAGSPADAGDVYPDAAPADGASLPTCGDHSCQVEESCSTCAADCGACPVRCGDGTCDPAESCSGCPGDCGACPSRGTALWLTSAQINSLPTSGAAWDEVKRTADGTFDSSSDHGWTSNSHWDTDTLAAALVAARLGLNGAGGSYRKKAADAIMIWARDPNYKSNGKMTYPARNIPSVIIAADTIDFPHFAGREADELEFRRFIADLRYECFGGQSNFQEATDRPNNKGTMALAGAAAMTGYLLKHGLPSGVCGSGVPSTSCGAHAAGQFTAAQWEGFCSNPSLEMDAIATALRGYLGDRGAYDGYSFSTADLNGGDDWQCVRNESYGRGPGNGYGVNPVGCMRDGHDIGGVLPDDQRRGGGFTWPPPKENYIYTATSGLLVAAVILHNHGYDTWSWGAQAIRRVFDWSHTQAHFPVTDGTAGSNDGWQTFIVNRAYGTSFPTARGSTGFNMAFTEWTFGAR